MGKQINTNLIQCPNCNSNSISFNESGAVCKSCHTDFIKINNTIIFNDFVDTADDSIDMIKSFLKRFNRFYQFLIYLISPVFSYNYTRKFINKYIKDDTIIAINLGSGNTDLSTKITNIDYYPYSNVNLTCDIKDIPIIDNCVDYIINNVVLEHVEDPYATIKEMHRILKKGGIICCAIPFIVGFHASPFDYHRFTYEGMKLLFKDFEIMELKVAGGPTSGLLWILQEWLALVLSFGSKKLHLILYLLIMLLTFPIKFLDIVLIHHPLAKNIASSFYILARKK